MREGIRDISSIQGKCYPTGCNNKLIRDITALAAYLIVCCSVQVVKWRFTGGYMGGLSLTVANYNVLLL